MISIKTFEFSKFLYTLLFVAGLAGNYAHAEFTSKNVKVIQWGWGTPQPSYTLNNLDWMTDTAFDGLGFDIIEDGGYDVTVFRWGWNNWNPIKDLDIADYSQQYNIIMNNSFQRFDHNFQRMNVSNVDARPVDWFWPEFDTIISNAGKTAKIAKDGGLKGILFDTEPYNGTNPWRYEDQPDKHLHSLAEYEVKVRQRAQQIMQAWQQEYPDLEILMPYGYYLAQKYPSHYYLLTHFLDGLLDAAQGETVIYDGWEFAYGYRTEDEYTAAYYIMKNQMLSWVADPVKFTEHYKAGFGVWPDYYAGVYGNPPWDTVNFDNNYFKPPDLYQSLQAAVNYSEKYVWLYSEYGQWWDVEPTLSEMPEPYRDILWRLRKKGQLERFDGNLPDTDTWEHFSSAGDISMSLTQNENLIINGYLYASNEDYTTKSLTVQPGWKVSVQITPLDTLTYGASGLFLTNDSGSLLQRTKDDSRYMAVMWANAHDAVYAACNDQNGETLEKLWHYDHKDMTFIYEIQWLNSQTAKFSIFDKWNKLLSTSNLYFEDMPSQLYISLYASSARIKFDNIWIEEIVVPSHCKQALYDGFVQRGDLNKDCKVDLEDFRKFVSEWMQVTEF